MKLPSSKSRVFVGSHLNVKTLSIQIRVRTYFTHSCTPGVKRCTPYWLLLQQITPIFKGWIKSNVIALWSWRLAFHNSSYKTANKMLLEYFALESLGICLSVWWGCATSSSFRKPATEHRFLFPNSLLYIELLFMMK